MNNVMLGGLVTFFGLLIMFILSKIYENKRPTVEDRREPDQSLVGVYSELLHITTVCTRLDMGMAELIRMHSDPDSKFATVKLREDMRELRKELNEDIESLRKSIESSSKKN